MTEPQAPATEAGRRLRPEDDYPRTGPLFAYRRGRHLYARIGRAYQNVSVSHAPSWDQPRYSRFGAWFHHRGLTLRYRGWLLHLTVRS